MKTIFLKISTILISILVGLLLCELILRFLLFSDFELAKNIKSAELYANNFEYNQETFYTEDYFKLRFLFNPNHPKIHSTFGWVGSFFSDNYRHFQHKEVKERRPVLLYGDSFAHCIDSTSCFDEILNVDASFNKNHYFLNYGVGGYGVDQASILLDSTLDLYDRPFVIFSLLTYDLDRSMLKFRDSQKPYYNLNNDSLILKGVPLNESNEVYLDENPTNIYSFSWSLFKNSNLFPFKQNESRAQNYIEKSKALNGAILEKTIQTLDSRNIDYAFLIFHKKVENFDNWRLKFLRDFLTKKDIPFFVDTELYHAKNTVNFYEDTIYTIRGDGHPTSYANRIVAQELKKIILDPTRLDQLRKNNLRWIDPAFTQLMYYEEMILNQKDWYDNISRQAVERNIPIDSAIYLNARYMLETQKNMTLKDVHYFKNQIRNSEEWLAEEQQKATNRSISLDSMILIDAEYMYNEQLKSIHNQLHSSID